MLLVTTNLCIDYSRALAKIASASSICSFVTISGRIQRMMLPQLPQVRRSRFCFKLNLNNCPHSVGIARIHRLRWRRHVPYAPNLVERHTHEKQHVENDDTAPMLTLIQSLAMAASRRMWGEQNVGTTRHATCPQLVRGHHGNEICA